MFTAQNDDCVECITFRFDYLYFGQMLLFSYGQFWVNVIQS